MNNKMTKLIFTFCLLIAWIPCLKAQILLGTGGYTQDFNAFTGANPPNGWMVSATGGTNCGSSTAGSGYAYGSGSDYALGYLPSTSLTSYTARVTFTNNTGSIITGLTIAYDFETWRRGQTRDNGFAVTISTGQNVSALNQTFTGGSGNCSQEVIPKTVTLSGLSIAANQTFFITWTGDRGSGSGSSNGVAIDNFSIMPVVQVPSCGPSSTPDLSFGGTLTTCAPGTVNLTTAGIIDANTTTGTFTYYSNPQATVTVPDPAAVGASGTYYVVKTTTVGNCRDTVAVPVVINPAPDASVDPAGPFCQYDNAITLSVNTSGGTFSGAGITDPVLGTFDPAFANTGTNTITYAVTDGNGCSASGNLVITVNATPDASVLSPDTTVCYNATAFDILPVNAGGVFSGTGIIDMNQGTFDAITAGQGVFQVVYALSQNNCSATDTAEVTVLVSPDASVLTSDTVVCDHNGTFQVLPLNTGGVFSGTGIVDVNLGTFDPAVAGAGAFDIVYQFTQSGCMATDTVVITVNAAPDASILTPDTTVCGQDFPFLIIVLNGSGQFSGTGITDPVTGEFDPAASGTGVFDIVYTLVQNSCTSYDTIQVTTLANPVVNITHPGDQCINDELFNVTADLQGGTWSGAGITDVNLGTFDPVTAGTGNTTLIYEVIQNGCTGSDTITLEVYALPVPQITDPGAQCTGSNDIQLSAAPQGGTWSGNFVSTSGLFDLIQSGAGTFSVYYSVTENGCTNMDTLDLDVNATAQVTVTEPDDSVCINEVAYIPSVIPSGGVWSGTGIITGGLLDPSLLAPGAHSVTYDVVQNNCPASHTWNFDVISVPVASFTWTQNGNVVDVQASAQVGETYFWDFGDGTTGNGESVSHTYTQNGNYTIMLVTAGYCGTDTAYQSITVSGLALHNPETDFFVVGPVPVETFLTISPVKPAVYDIVLWDITGRKVLQFAQQTGTVSLNMAHLPSGTYVLQMESEGKRMSRKIIKK